LWESTRVGGELAKRGGAGGEAGVLGSVVVSVVWPPGPNPVLRAVSEKEIELPPGKHTDYSVWHADCVQAIDKLHSNWATGGFYIPVLYLPVSPRLLGKLQLQHIGHTGTSDISSRID
ncbi:hypothetical protein AYI68_g5172, partial [Smittium mucronatum]